MALTIPDEEMDLCKELGRPAFAALSLANDLFSWEKERDEARRKGVPHVVNAIWVLMGELSIGEEEAKEVCRQRTKDYVAETVRVARETRERTDLSLDLRVYVEAIQYSVSGNLVWSVYCPRYHPEFTYDDTVLSMMADVQTIMPGRNGIMS